MLSKCAAANDFSRERRAEFFWLLGQNFSHRFDLPRQEATARESLFDAYIGASTGGTGARPAGTTWFPRAASRS
jgi:hypothetical protein